MTEPGTREERGRPRGGWRRAPGILVWFLGVALCAALVRTQGFREVFGVLATSGWWLLCLALYHPIQTVVDSAGWAQLLPATHRPPFRSLVWMRWVGESVNGLLPVASVGGEVVKARLLTRAGTGGAEAGASVVADLTVGLASEAAFALMGLAALSTLARGALPAGWAAGFAGAGAVIAVFYLAQRWGLFGRVAGILERLMGGEALAVLVGGAGALDRAVRSTYRRRRSLAACFSWRLLGWILGTGEVWFALRLLGVEVTVTEAFVLESLGQAVRSVGFAIPGALGVQEGGFVLIGKLVGLGPETALALSLAKRVREVLLGLPGLLCWSWVEGQRLLPGRTQAL